MQAECLENFDYYKLQNPLITIIICSDLLHQAQEARKNKKDESISSVPSRGESGSLDNGLMFTSSQTQVPQPDGQYFDSGQRMRMFSKEQFDSPHNEQRYLGHNEQRHLGQEMSPRPQSIIAAEVRVVFAVNRICKKCVVKQAVPCTRLFKTSFSRISLRVDSLGR